MVIACRSPVLGPVCPLWWSWRGKAFDSDAGWRIDYQLSTADLAARAVRAEADKAARCADRWSDHAALVIVFDLVAGPLP